MGVSVASRVLFWQGLLLLALTIFFALLGWVINKDFLSKSAALGGLVVVIPSFLFVFRMRFDAWRGYVWSARYFLAAQIIKLVVSFVLMALVFKWVANVNWLVFFLSLILTSKVHWVALGVCSGSR